MCDTQTHCHDIYIFFSDIVDGNIKAIMRLILALAAHFKPRSVRQTATSSPQPQNSNTTLTGIAHVS